jgi:hypothetical protein
VDQIQEIACAAHRAASWHAPPSPLRIAIAQQIRVRPQCDIAADLIVVGSAVLYTPTGDRRTTGVRIAEGIARVLLMRHIAPHTEGDVHRLAVELLVPAWILRGRLCDLEEAHVWAPRDLIRDQWRVVVLGPSAVA